MKLSVSYEGCAFTETLEAESMADPLNQLLAKEAVGEEAAEEAAEADIQVRVTTQLAYRFVVRCKKPKDD